MQPGREVWPRGRFEWERLVLRIPLSERVKLFALAIATFSDPDGSRVHPGNEVLANITGCSARTVSRVMVDLRRMDLLTVTRRGGGRNAPGRATEYQLTIPSDLMDRFELLDPGFKRPHRGATQSTPQNQTPAVDRAGTSNDRGATVGAVQNGHRIGLSGDTQVAPQTVRAPPDRVH